MLYSPQNKMSSGKKDNTLVHALPVLAAVLAVAVFVPRSSSNHATNSNPAKAELAVRDPPRTAEDGLINWATDRGAKVSMQKFSSKQKEISNAFTPVDATIKKSFQLLFIFSNHTLQ
jgi:hypothetical protein